ncbi:hypothetical protein ABPG72_019312 [Tetrahymena utriculariae]
MNKETLKSIQEIQDVPIRFYSQNFRFSSVSLFQPIYSINAINQYLYQFDLPIFGQKNIDTLAIKMIKQEQTSQLVIDWHIALLKCFTFKKLQIEISAVSNYLKRIFDLQQNIDTLELFYFNQYDTKPISDFLSCQDKLKSLRHLMMSFLSLSNEQSNFKKCIPQFISNNIDALETLQLVLDIRTMLFTIRNIINNSQKECFSENMNEIHLFFRSLNIQSEQQYYQEQENIYDQLLHNFFRKFQGLNKVSLIFQQSLLDIQLYNNVCEVLEYQKQFNQLKELVIFFTHSRIQFDLLELFNIIYQFTALETLSISLDFSTQVIISKPEEIIKLDRIKNFKLSLAYCPCSNQITEYICFNNLKKLAISLNYINNKENISQSFQNISSWIQDNPMIEDLQISMWHSAAQDCESLSTLLESIDQKLKQIKFSQIEGIPEKFLEIEKIKWLEQCQDWYLSFDNLIHFSYQDSVLSIKNNEQSNIQLNIIKSVIDLTKLNVKQIFFRIQNIIFENHLTDEQKLEAFMNLFLACNKLRVLNLSIDYFHFNNQMIDILINKIMQIENLLSFQIIQRQYHLYLSAEQQKKVLDHVSNKIIFQNMCLSSLTFNLQNWLRQRYTFFKRVIKTLQLYQQSNALKNYRKDIINYLIDFSYNNC